MVVENFLVKILAIENDAGIMTRKPPISNNTDYGKHAQNDYRGLNIGVHLSFLSNVIITIFQR